MAPLESMTIQTQVVKIRTRQKDHGYFGKADALIDSGAHLPWCDGGKTVQAATSFWQERTTSSYPLATKWTSHLFGTRLGKSNLGDRDCK